MDGSDVLNNEEQRTFWDIIGMKKNRYFNQETGREIRGKGYEKHIPFSELYAYGLKNNLQTHLPYPQHGNGNRNSNRNRIKGKTKKKQSTSKSKSTSTSKSKSKSKLPLTIHDYKSILNYYKIKYPKSYHTRKKNHHQLKKLALKTLKQKVCSCQFKVKQKGKPLSNAIAICRHSVLNRKGFTPKYLKCSKSKSNSNSNSIPIIMKRIKNKGL